MLLLSVLALLLVPVALVLLLLLLPSPSPSPSSRPCAATTGRVGVVLRCLENAAASASIRC